MPPKAKALKLKAKNTIMGLKDKPILAGETFTCGIDEGARLIELDAAEEIEVPETTDEEPA